MRISDWSSDVCSSDLFVASRKVHQSSYQDGATIFYGPSVIYLSKKFHAPTLDCTSFGPAAKNADVQRNFDRIEKALKPALSNLGGHIIRGSGAEGFDEKLHILVPFAIAMSASSTADYFAAIDYLINASTDEPSHKVTIGRSNVCNPLPNANHVCRILLQNKYN